MNSLVIADDRSVDMNRLIFVMSIVGLSPCYCNSDLEFCAHFCQAEHHVYLFLLNDLAAVAAVLLNVPFDPHGCWSSEELLLGPPFFEISGQSYDFFGSFVTSISTT